MPLGTWTQIAENDAIEVEGNKGACNSNQERKESFLCGVGWEPIEPVEGFWEHEAIYIALFLLERPSLE
jgi:hypothetical protein